MDQTGTNAFGFAVINLDQDYGPYTANTYQQANSYFTWDLNNPPIGHQFGTAIAIRSIILKAQNPNWSNLRVLWEASRETIQFGLDIVGLVPLLGEVADITNGVIYTLYGDGINASLSFANAVPVVGWASAGVKLAVMRVPKALGGYTTLKWIKNADGSLSFGDGKQLRRVLGLTDSNVHAHHIIPQELANHPLVQQAARSQHAFHMNKAENGIGMLNNLHLTGHPTYTTKISRKLSAMGENLSPDQAYQKLSELMEQVRSIIQQFPDKNLEEISKLIN